MNRSVSILVVLELGLALVAPTSIGAQQQSEQRPSFRVGVDQVFLSVNARSVHGGFVRDLKKEDFRVFEDGVEQEILNFATERVPVHVVLLMDASGSTAYAQGEIRRAAMKFSEGMDEQDNIAIITFNDAARLAQDWTNDLKEIELALQSIYAKGPTVLHDALYVTFDDLLRGINGKKAVILLTDGIDTGSLVSFDDAYDLAVRSEAMIYVVSKLNEYRRQAQGLRVQIRARGQRVPRELTDDHILEVNRSLQKMARLTGGKVLSTSEFLDLTDIYAQVTEELKNQYYLSYIPTNRAKDGRWREIEIRVDIRPDVVVTTRRGYFAEGPRQP